MNEIKEYVASQEPKFKYMLLSRLEQDCKYFLGNGSRHVKHLWASTVEEHIEYMKELWNSLAEKPEWISMEQIEKYESEMKEEDPNRVEIVDFCRVTHLRIEDYCNDSEERIWIDCGSYEMGDIVVGKDGREYTIKLVLEPK